MTERGFIQSDQAQLNRVVAGENFFLAPKSQALERFLILNVCWDGEKEGPIEAEYLRKFTGEQWFRTEIKKYGFKVQ